MNAVAVTSSKYRNKRRPLRNEFRSVAHARAGRDAAQTDNPRTQTHHRLQRQLPLRFRTPFRGIIARMIAVQDHAGAHHVSPAFRTRCNRGAIGHVYDASVDAQLAQALQGSEEALFLLARLLALWRRRECFRGSEMRHHSAKPKMFALCELPREAFHIAGGDAEAIHSRIEFQVKRNRLARRSFCRGTIQRLQLLATMYHRGQIMLQQICFFAGPKTGQHQNWLAYACFANLDTFICASNAEPVRTRLLQYFGNLRSAMPIAVALHNREHFAWRLTLFVRRIDEIANRPQVVYKRGRGNLRPHGSPFNLHLFFLSRRHGRPERQIVYDIPAAGTEAQRGCFLKDNSQVRSNRQASRCHKRIQTQLCCKLLSRQRHILHGANPGLPYLPPRAVAMATHCRIRPTVEQSGERGKMKGCDVSLTNGLFKAPASCGRPILGSSPGGCRSCAGISKRFSTLIRPSLMKKCAPLLSSSSEKSPVLTSPPRRMKRRFRER